MTRDLVLTMLKQAGDQFCSGESISKKLGVSRAAIWKAVDTLRQDGYEIASVPRLGYRLEHSPDRLSAGELRHAIQNCTIGGNLICLEHVDSTNNYAKKLADEGAPHGTVVLSEHQTDGRGRQGKNFSSPQGKGLYLSALLRPKYPPMNVINLTAWAAVAVCDAVEQIIGERPGIKWTNDIILHNRKLCGILTEMGLEAESGQLQYVVIGVGINVSQNEQDFSGELSPIAISLEQASGQKVRRADLAAAVMRALDRMMQDFPTEKQTYLDRYRTDCLTVGHEVRLIQKSHTEIAFAHSIDDNFALVVRKEDGTMETVTAGDVSVRGLLGYV